MGFCHFDLSRYVSKWFVSPLSLPPYFRRMEAFLKLALPIGWQSLSDSQLLYFFRRFSRNLPMEEILTLCLFKWADLRVLCCTPPQKKNGSYLVMRRHAPKQQALLPSSKFRPPLAPLTTSTISRLCPSASQPSAKHTLSTETSWKCRSVNSITAFLLHSFSTIFL